MRIRRVIACFATWTITWVVCGAIIGTAMGFGDLHGTPLGVLLLTVVMGAILGAISGGVFAPLFSWVTPHRLGKSVRVGVPTGLGALSGMFGMSIGGTAVGLRIPSGFVVCGVVGAIAGLICGALLNSE